MALDSNVLVYFEGVDDRERRDRIVELLTALGRQRILLPVQALGELFRVLLRKGRRQPSEAADQVHGWRTTCTIWPTTEAAFIVALELAAAHHLQIWDALIIAVAADAGCRLLLSEDLQHGAVFAGVTVVDPFLVPYHPMLAAALAS